MNWFQLIVFETHLSVLLEEVAQDEHVGRQVYVMVLAERPVWTTRLEHILPMSIVLVTDVCVIQFVIERLFGWEVYTFSRLYLSD